MMTDGETGADPATPNPQSGAVLRRFLAVRDTGQAPDLPKPAPKTAPAAAATAVGRAVERLYHVGYQPSSVEPGAYTLAELPEVMPSPALYAVIEGEGERMGVMALCPSTVAAMIELQTLGRVTTRPPEKRRIGRSEAMLCADFVNSVMTDLATELSGIAGFDDWSGFRYASYVDDARPLLLMLDDVPFRSLSIQARIGDDQGRALNMFLALPQAAATQCEPVAVEQVHLESILPAANTSARSEPSMAIAAAVQSVKVELIGVLCRKRISLGELRALGAGASIAIPRASMSDVTLETRSGQTIARGKLGELDGCHAIRLADPNRVTFDQDCSEPPQQDLHTQDAFRSVEQLPTAAPAPIEPNADRSIGI